MHPVEHHIAQAFRMSDDVWQRHANPWSVWTRFTVLPLLVLAVWSRMWLGWWSLVPIGVALLWMWLNPRIFPRPHSTDNWASKAVLGERVWIERKKLPIPAHLRSGPTIFSIFSLFGMLSVILGVWQLQIWPTVAGIAIIYNAKLLFLMRMVKIYESVREILPEYVDWA